MLHPFYREKSRNNCTSGLRSNRELPQPHLCQMVEVTYQNLGNTQKAVQCRRNRKQSRGATFLHRSTSPDGRNQDPIMILPIGSRRTQSNPRIFLVRSSATQHRLEARMDRPHPAASNSAKPRRKESGIRPQTL
jgi:hypothetical protein